MTSRFYAGAAVFMILLVAAGFGPSILDESKRNLPLTPLVIAHGALTGGWLLLFLAQATLVARRRIAAHRLLGWAGALLAAATIAVGYLAIVGMMRRGYDLSGDITRAAGPPGSPPPGPADAWIPLTEFLIFGVLVGAALCFRRRPEIHKRLMVLALVSLALEPIFHLVGYVCGRWPALWGPVSTVGLATQVLLLFAPAINDRLTRGRIHPVSLWAPVAVSACVTIFIVGVSPSSAWQDLAAWLVR
jgi:hypothetical protein